MKYLICKRGFTLIEILVSISLIAVGIIPIARVITQSMSLSVKEERLTKVIFLAEEKIEEVICKVINNYATSRDESAAAFSSPYTEYKYTVTDDEVSETKTISVAVWHDEDSDGILDSNEQSITLYTRVSDRS